MEQQAMVPNGMGYVGAQNNDALIAATAAIASIGAKNNYAPTDNGISSILAMSMLNKDCDKGRGKKEDWATTDQICNLQGQLGEAKSGIIGKIGDSTSDIKDAIQGNTMSMHDRATGIEDKMCNGEGRLMEAINGAKDAAREAGHNSETRDLESRFIIANRIGDFERSVGTQFCDVKHDIQKGFGETAKDIMGVNFNLEKVNTHLTHLIDTSTSKLEFQAERNKSDLSLQMERGFCKVREDDLQDEIAALRRANDSNVMVTAFSNQINAINSVLIDLQQTARATNQTIQFGAGNVATPVATNNQVR